MALKVNQVTGQLEDDGVPEPETLRPPVAPTGLEMPGTAPPIDAQGAVGAAPSQLAAPRVATNPNTGSVAPIVAGSLFPAKPESETTVTRTVKTEAAKEADQALGTARADRDQARQEDTAIKVEEAQVTAEEATMKRLAMERENADREYWESEKKRIVARNLEEDKKAREQHAADLVKKNQAGELQGSAQVWAKVLTAIGAAGQAFAAAGSRGFAAWQDGNPVAKIYEENRQREVTKALEKFRGSEDYRKKQEEGREKELKIAEEELTIGAQNRANAYNKAISMRTSERLAKLGPKARQAAAQLLQAADQIDDAKTDQQNEQGYASRVSSVNRTGGGSPAQQATQGTLWVPDPETGQPIPTPNVKPEEAAKARESYGNLNPIKDTLDRVKGLVGGTDWKDRVPVLGSTTADQQKIAGELATLEAPISQLLGSGTPQEGEAKRRLRTLSVSASQGKEVSQSNVDALKDYIESSYRERVAALNPQVGQSLRDRAKARIDEKRGASPAPTGGQSWKPERKTISTGTYERTGPGAADWKKVQ